ncbi:MAG: IS66 family transposase [Polyangiaceae bacterium]|nr:IS66 family transposase [Polyangiaceae bacterium]
MTTADYLAELARRDAELSVIRAENARQAKLIESLTEQLVALTERIAELIAAVERKKGKPPIPKPVAPATLTEAEREAFENRPRPPEKPVKPKEPKPRAKPTGRKPLPKHLPEEVHHFRPTACDHCGGAALDQVDEVTEEKLHVVKEHQRRRVVTRFTCRCRACGERTTPASLPAPFPRSKITGEWLAWLMHQKFSLLVPLDRVRRDLKERGIAMAMSTLVSYVERAADLLAAIDGYHWKQLLAGRWMATDATGLKVLVKGLPEAHNGYLEQFHNHDAVVFQYAATKHAEGIESKLAGFRGTLTADAEHRLNGVYGEHVLEAGCNAHARRRFRDAEATQPALALEGGKFIGAMYGVEEDARKEGLTGKALLARRRERAGPIAKEFDEWRAATLPGLLPSEPLAQAIRYYDRHREALLRFLEDPEVPLDNSATERRFQHVAKLRLNMLFAGSTEGAHRACVLLGVSATCRTMGVSFEQYLAWAFERLGTHREVFGLPVSELTPAAFKLTLGG